MRIGTLNIWGRWADWPSRVRALSQAWPAEGLDVLLLQEVVRDAEGDQGEEVAARLGFSHAATAEGHRTDTGGCEGLAILSREALGDVAVLDLPDSDPVRRALRATVDVDGTAVSIVCGHTVAVPEDVRARQVQALLRRPEEAVVLGADLNDVPDRVHALVHGAGLVDCLDGTDAPTWPMCHITFGDAWRSQLGRAPHFSLERRRLDYLLVRGVRVVDAGVEDLRGPDGTYASDHALVWAELAGA